MSNTLHGRGSTDGNVQLGLSDRLTDLTEINLIVERTWDDDEKLRK